ncbi:mucin-17-like isoform X2 [Mastacembelus armatus]|nr:mucin-17-like isoform X2 [Mastacembelus armatus]
MASLQPKTEGSLRRRLLSAKIHQQQDSIWGMNSVSRSGSHSGDKRSLPLHLQYPGNGLCYRSQNLPLQPHTHPSFAAEAHGKLQPQVPPLPQQRSSCPVLMQRHRTSSCPLTLEPRPGYNLPAPPPFSTQYCLGKPEVPTCYPYRPSRRRRNGLICVRRHRGRSSRLEATQTTPLLQRAGNGDSTWSVHYSTQKPQHGLLFIPGKGQSSSTDELQVCNRLTQHGDASHLHQPRPASSLSSCGLNQSEASKRSAWKSRSRKMSSVSSDEDERCILTSTRPLTPLVLSPVSLTSCCDVFAPTYEPTSRLPTPEERMRQQAEAVGADIVPINVTGESFDRQASFRRPLSSVDSLARRPRNLGHRKTVTGTPDISQNPDLPLILPGQDLTVGPPAVSSCTSTHWQNNTEEEAEETCRAQITKQGQSSARRVCDPKGDGISSLMVSVTSSQCVDSCQDRAASCCTSSSEVHSPPHLATNWSLKSEASCNCASYWKTLIASSSCHQSQDLQGFPSDLHPLLPFDPTARVIPQSPFPSSSSFSSSSVTSSLPSTPSRILQSECSYSSDKPLIEDAQHHRFTITDSESQFTHQALDDQPAAQHDTQCSNDGGSYNWERCGYQPLSVISSGQTRTKWNSITQETRCLSGEGCSCDPLLSSGHSSPTCTDRNSMCAEKITTSHLLKREKTNSSPSTCCRTVTRSISLCKSKRPPPPPLRSVSLSCRPSCSKPSCSSSSSRLEYSPCLELTTQRTHTSYPQTFQDPWVPRKNTKTPQSGLNFGRVTTFESLSPDCLVANATESSPSEYLHLNPGHFHGDVFPPGSPGSEKEGLTFSLSPQPTAPSMAGLPCLASPSSGYSSQSNTPAPGTPLSSPITPCSPVTASPKVFSLPLTSPSSSSHSNSLPASPSISSLPRTRSWKRRGKEERRPKPPVPERKSSLFSSTSSLSCTSSKYPLLPSPPSPPPLPKCSFPTVYYSPVCESAPPESPSTTKLSVAPPCQPSSISLPPPPPPLPPLPPFSLPLPFLLSPSSRPSPPPYSYAIRQPCHHTLEDAKSSISFPPLTSLPPPPSTVLPPISGLSDLPPAELPPPPPPPLPTLPTLSASPFPSSSFGKSQNNCLKMAKSPCPLVTAQALQGIKLRAVKNQEGRLTSIVPTDAPSVDLSSQAGMLSANASPANTCHDLPSKEVHPDCAVANAALDDLCNTEVKLIDPGSQNAVCTLGGNENNTSSAIMDYASFHNLANTDAKQPRFKSNHEYYNLTKSEMRTSNEDSVPSPANQGNSWFQVTSVETPQDIPSSEQDREAMQSNNQLASPDEPWLKVSYNNGKNHNTNFQQSPSQQQVKDAMLTGPAEKQGNTAAIWHMDSSCWALSRKNQTCHRESRILVESRDEVEINDGNSDVQNHSAVGRDFTTYCDVKQNDEVFQPDSPRKHLFPEKPKHSHCFLGFTAPLETRNVQITAASPGIHFHLPLPPGCSCTHLTPAQRYLTCTAEKTQITCDITTLPTHSVDAASPLVNTRPADITIQTLATSPQMQKLPILHNEPDLSLISPSTAQQFVAQNTGEAPKSTSGICGTLENTGILQTQSTSWVVSTVGSRNTLTRMMGAMERRTSGSTHIEMGTCTSSMILNNMEPWSSKGAPNNINGTNLEYNLENCDTWGTSETYNILRKSGVQRAASNRTDDNQTRAEIMRTRHDDEKTLPKTKKRSLLAGHEEQQEKHRLEDRGKKTIMMSSFSTNHKDKGRKRRVSRQLLMMSPTVQPSFSSSSSSSSSEDEQDVVKGQTMRTSERVRMTKVCDGEMSDSESSCSLNGQNGYSLSSALSTDSSQGELSLPDLQIQEPGEEIFRERSKEEAQKSGMDARETRGSPDADLFVSISADQMFVSSQPRTTEDLFAVIHRLKKKMLGRKESEEDRHCIPSSSSSPLLSPIGHLLRPTQPAALRSQKSARSESFKALLLKKGSRSESSSRISAVERLCKVVAPAAVADLQKAPSLPPPPDQTQGKPTRLSHSSDTLDVNAHMTLDMPLSPTSLWGQNSVMLGLRLKDHNRLLFTSSSPPVFFLSPSPMHPRSLAPPCSYRRHFAARCRLFAAPMAAIFEGEHEEEEENSVFVASPGTKGEMSQRLLEIP